MAAHTHGKKEMGKMCLKPQQNSTWGQSFPFCSHERERERESKGRCYTDRETKKGVISRGRQQVAKLCILGHPPLVPLHFPFSSCPFFLKHSDCHLTPPRVIFLEGRKPPFSLFLICPQPKPTVAFPTTARCTRQGRSQLLRGAPSLSNAYVISETERTGRDAELV